MKVKIIVPDFGFNVGDVVEAKYFKDLTEQEVETSTHDESMWNSLDVFIYLSLATETEHLYGYMRDEEVKIIEDGQEA